MANHHILAHPLMSSYFKSKHQNVLWIFCFSLVTLTGLSAQINQSLKGMELLLAQKLSLLENGDVLVTGQTGHFPSYPDFRPFLACYSPRGELRWQQIYGTEFFEYQAVSELIQDKITKDILFSFKGEGCDYEGSHFLVRTDSLGDSLKILDLFGYPMGVQDFVQLQDGTWLVVVCESYEWFVAGFNNDFSELLYLTESVEACSRQLQLTQTEGDTVFALLDRSIRMIYPRFGEAISVSESVEIDWHRDLGILLLQDDRLETYTSSLDFVRAVDLNEFGKLTHMDARDSTLYITSFHVDSPMVYHVLDLDLNVRTSHSFQDPYLLIRDMAALDDSTLISCGYERRKLNSFHRRSELAREPGQVGRQSFLRTDCVGQANQSPVDIGLDRVFSYQLEVDEFQCFERPWTSLQLTDVEFRVENLGRDTINSLSINVDYRPCDIFCLRYRTARRRFENLGIAPGRDTVLVASPMNFVMEGSLDSVEICFYLDDRGGLLDVNHESNQICSREILVSTQELPLPEAPQLFPNPAQTEVFSTYKISNISFEIYGIQGDLVAQGLTESDGAINIAALPSGLYFVVLHHENESSTHKLVIAGN